MPEARLRFNRLALTVDLFLSPAHLRSYLDRPHEIVGWVTQRMTVLQKAGAFADFEVYEDRLLRILNRQVNLERPAGVRFIVAAGRPRLEGLRVTAGLQVERANGLLTISAKPELAARWHPDWVVAHVVEELARRGVDAPINPSDVQAAWLRHCRHGESITNYPLYAPPRANPKQFERAFFLRASPKRQLVELIIGDPSSFQAPNVRRSIMQRAAEAVESLGEKLGLPYLHVCERHLHRQMLYAVRGPQALGLELPLAVLAGVVLGDKAGREVASQLGSSGLADSPAQEGASSSLASLESKLVYHRVSRGRALPVGDQQTALVPMEPRAGEQHLMVLDERGLLPAKSAARRAMGRGIKPVRFVDALPERHAYLRRTALIAVQSMETLPPDRRDVQAVTICIAEERRGELQTRLATLHAALKHMADRITSPTQLVHINWQFFPFTRIAPQLPARLPEAGDEAWHMKAGWRNLIVREMVGLKGFRAEGDWLRSQLYPPLSRAALEETLLVLERQGHIKRTGKSWVQTNANIMAEQVRGDAVVRFHEGMIMLGLKALDLVPPERLEMKAALLPCDEVGFNEMKALVLDTLKDLFGIASRMQNPDQVYQLNSQMFLLANL